MTEDPKKEAFEECVCDPEHSPTHDAYAHADEKDGPGATGWKNPLANAPEGATYEDIIDSNDGPGVKK